MRTPIGHRMLKIGNPLAATSSRISGTVALLSCEAEYAALSAAASEGLHEILEDLKQVRPGTAFKSFEDNHGCIALATNTESKRVKHFDFFTRSCSSSTTSNRSNWYRNLIAHTEALEPERFRELRTLL